MSVIAICYPMHELIRPQALGDGLSLHDVQTGQGGFMATLTYLLSTTWQGNIVGVVEAGPLDTFRDVSLDALEMMLRHTDQRTFDRVSMALEWQVNTAKMAICGESPDDPALVRYRAIFGKDWGKRG